MDHPDRTDHNSALDMPYMHDHYVEEFKDLPLQCTPMFMQTPRGK